MKIVYCLPSIFNSGGIERVLANKGNWLVNHGYDVTILTTEQKGRFPFFYFDSRIKHVDLGINYWDNNSRSFFRKIYYYFYNKYRHKEKLCNYLLKAKADVVVSLFSHELSFLLSLKDGSVKILECHFTKYRYLKGVRSGLLSFVDRFSFYKTQNLISKFDKFIVLTEADKREWGGENTIVIPNSVIFTSNSVNNLVKRQIVAVGRLVYEKGFDRLIDIWEKFNVSHPGWLLNIIGDGILKSQLQELIVKKGLHDSIRIVSATKNIKEYYEEASILLMTSRNEGLGMVLIEAQSCGVPVVAYNCPHGPAEIINDGIDGFLVEDGNLDEFVRKLSKLADDDIFRRQMGRNCKINSQRFSEDLIMAQWDKLFKSYKK